MTERNPTSYVDAMAELESARQRIKKLEEKIKHLEITTSEPHTVLTRPEFNREVARMLALDERYGGVSSLLYFDVEGLEELDKRYGKEAVDEAIRSIVQTLTKGVRGSDIVGRLANDEFGVMLVRCSNTDAWKKGSALASMTLEAIGGKDKGLNISYGAYTFRDEEDPATGIKLAAEAVTKGDKPV